MKKTLLVIALSTAALSPANAQPLYIGMQIGDASAGALLGYQISKQYAVESSFSRNSSSISHAGITADTAANIFSLTGIALFPMKLNDVLPYTLFAQAGLAHTNTTETYTIPDTVTLTLPYSGSTNNQKNQFVLGAGAGYDFSAHITGRMGIDFIGKNRFLKLTALYRF